MLRIKRKKDGMVFAWSQPLSERKDMEVFDTEEKTPILLKDLEEMKRQELMTTAKKLGITDISKKKNTDLILEIHNL